MDKNVLDELREAKYAYETAQVCFFNSGIVGKENNDTAKRINTDNPRDSINDIQRVLTSAIKYYSIKCDFDTISMDLDLGIIYNIDDVNEDNTIKENREPIQGIVRFYTGSIKTLLNDQKTSKFDYGETGFGAQHYIRFDTLKAYIDKSGLSYTGPQTFDELKNRIQSGEKFNVSLTANLVEKKEKQIQETPKIKKLFFK